jgi:hypothetical protein
MARQRKNLHQNFRANGSVWDCGLHLSRIEESLGGNKNRVVFKGVIKEGVFNEFP